MGNQIAGGLGQVEKIIQLLSSAPEVKKHLQEVAKAEAQLVAEIREKNSELKAEEVRIKRKKKEVEDFSQEIDKLAESVRSESFTLGAQKEEFFKLKLEIEEGLKNEKLALNERAAALDQRAAVLDEDSARIQRENNDRAASLEKWARELALKEEQLKHSEHEANRMKSDYEKRLAKLKEVIG